MSLIYSLTCTDCGEELDHKITMDADSDLAVDVTPCESCKKAAYDEGYEDAKNEYDEGSL